MTNEELQAYMLGELSPAKRKEAEQHLGADPEAVQDAERLGTVIAALKRLPEEEPPLRIAFVSDKVFEPKWYERLWATGPRAAFASTAMLALSIVAHGFVTAPKHAPPVTSIWSCTTSPRSRPRMGRWCGSMPCCAGGATMA